MIKVKEIFIPSTNVSSLSWDGDSLIDWVSGGRCFYLNGDTVDARVRYAYPFDHAVTSASSNYTVICTKFGTKGLLLRRGEVIREINRSFYHANVYEYPVALFRLMDGRDVIAHCPDEYCRLEIDEVETGKRLTNAEGRKPMDFFHSRLNASADGRYLLSAGWIWHPVDSVEVFDVQAALLDPYHLDGKGLNIDAWADESSACFFQKRQMIVALNGIERNEDDGQADNSQLGELKIFDLMNPQEPIVQRTGVTMGKMMAVGNDHVLSLYQFPKLVDIRTGEIIQSWPQIKSGSQNGRIMVKENFAPPIALDVVKCRCAIANESGIFVLEFAL